MNKLVILIGTVVLCNCAGVQFERKTHLADLHRTVEAAPKLPDDYCTVSWDSRGNVTSGCVGFISREEMEDRIFMIQQSQQSCKEKDSRKPRYKSDE
jgi:hypothetical protein